MFLMGYIIVCHIAKMNFCCDNLVKELMLLKRHCDIVPRLPTSWFFLHYVCQQLLYE
jgi:hypothetical protein